LRLPKRIAPQGADVLGPLEYEIFQEKASNLARMGKRLDEALRALRAHDEAGGSPADERERLVRAAGEALWYFVVQREVCGFTDTETLIRDLGIPREVRLRMGFTPSNPRR